MPETDVLKRRLLFVLYLLACTALAYVAINVLLYIRLAVVLISVCILVAYLITPLVNFFIRVLPGQGRSGQRLVSILLSYVCIGMLVAVLAAYVFPVAGHELKHLTQDIQGLRDQHYVDQLTQWLTDRLPPEASDSIPVYVQQGVDQLQTLAVTLLKSSVPWVGQFFSGVVEAFLVPLLTLFILLDMDVYKRGFLRVFPRQHRHDVEALLKEIDLVMSGFVHGQMLVACVMGTSIAVVLWILNVPYAMLLGIFAGVVDIIPYLGVPLGMIPAFFSALSAHGFGTALLTIALMEALHMTEGKVVVPTVVGHSVKLPPLIVLLSIFIGAEMMGIIGMLLSIPIVGIVRVVINHYLPPEPVELGPEVALVPAPPLHEEGPELHLQKVAAGDTP